MAEFVNLNTEDDTLNIIPYSPKSLPVVTVDTTLIDLELKPIETDGLEKDDVYSLDLLPDEPQEDIDHVWVEGDCDVSRVYGTPNPDGSFKLENLFSELSDEYQREVARQNLGIGSAYAMLWGNISGNLINQTDLYNFVNTTVINKWDIVVTELNTLLAGWAIDIRTSLAQKAEIFSPIFTGVPTVPLPSLDDNSNQIASTSWVNYKLSIRGFNLQYLELSQDYMYYGESSISLVCTWNYNNAVTNQYINSIPLGNDVRSYTFTVVNSDKLITLSYTFNGEIYSQSIAFKKYYPIYFGKVLDYTKLTKTKDSSMTITCGTSEYAYIYVPTTLNARITVDNIVGGFALLGTMIISSITYNVYKTVNPNLGQLNISILW